MTPENSIAPKPGDRFTRITDDPFDDTLCEVVAVKAGWVQYSFCLPPSREVGHARATAPIKTFLEMYKPQATNT